ncbi:MAG: nucleotide exchange factor GrpE, partial [Alistipes sp.]
MKTKKNKIDMKKEKVYNEAVKGDEGFVEGEAYPSCEGEGCDNMTEKDAPATDTMADDALSDVALEAAAWRDKFMRLQAEFDNYRKRTLREKMELVETGGKEVLLAMLPVRDDVQRAFAAMAKSDDIEALREGVRLISQKFTDTLRTKGVTEMELQGKEFDADQSEAVARFAGDKEMKDKVIEVVQTGYMLGDKVLRFAKV